MDECKLAHPNPGYGDGEKEEFVGDWIENLAQIAGPAEEAGDKSVKELASQSDGDHCQMPALGQERKGDGQDQPNNGDSIGNMRIDAGLDFSHRDGVRWLLSAYSA